MNPWTRLSGWLSFGLLIIASFILVLRYVEKAPFFYLGLETFFVLLFLSYKLKRHNFLKALFFNLAIVVLLLGLAEAYFTWLRAPIIQEGQIKIKEEYLQGGIIMSLMSLEDMPPGPTLRKESGNRWEKKSFTMLFIQLIVMD
jgi:hypothetical protein